MSKDEKSGPESMSVGKSTTKARRTRKTLIRKTRYLALEQRIVFDGALAADIADKATEAPADTAKQAPEIAAPAVDWLSRPPASGADTPALPSAVPPPPSAPLPAASAAPAERATGDVAARPAADTAPRSVDVSAPKSVDYLAPRPVDQSAALAGDTASEIDHPVATIETSPAAARVEIVFVDTSVEDYQTLIAGVDPSARVVLLDGSRDAVDQMLRFGCEPGWNHRQASASTGDPSNPIAHYNRVASAC